MGALKDFDLQGNCRNQDRLIALLDNSYMALLNVLCYPDPRLHQVAKPVAQVDARIKKIVADMADTMYEAPGVGLAATQVDIHERIVIIDISDEQNDLRQSLGVRAVFQSPIFMMKLKGPHKFE